ncbi:hypothetical protein HPP92_000839 [Vanilla planifolia]|uniref:C2 NT-type domain-containing protein n=1 Tax=Vanilla planifolia TaxID=51239 RepID=A0A835VJ51_VANPL|nr:hypothetical protein HPP92_000839 [Vanilla planifolia]
MRAEVRWKGPKMRALSSLRRTVKRNCTMEEEVSGDKGEVEWNEEFGNVVGLTTQKGNVFNRWEIEIAVFNVTKFRHKNKVSIVGMASFNLSDYASCVEETNELQLPLILLTTTATSAPIVHVSLRLLELTCAQETEKPVSPAVGDSSPSDKGDSSGFRAGFRKISILKQFMPGRRLRKALHDDEGSDGKYSAKSENACYAYPLDTDSFDDEDDDPIDPKECGNNAIIRKSFSYGTLADAKSLASAFYCDMKMNKQFEDLVYYSHRSNDVDSSHETQPSVSEESIFQTTKRSILPWKKRKYTLRSAKAKGEPLLKKSYGEDGGDDIDYARRLLSSSEESLSGKSAEDFWISEFGDDRFVIGTWEWKITISRSAQFNLCTNVFFASIDQRSERAAGESACTALVAVIADWFQSNPGMIPIKSQLDILIREGSLQWRSLCKTETYRERFPDGHFDLETIMQAKIRPISVAADKSYVGFFHPEGYEDNSMFEFLHGAMSFDNIWEEISQVESDCLFIVSWNDHFFVLKVERDVYYIIDTLGERLYEGCDQAYILKFDRNTTINKITCENQDSSAEQKEISCGEEESKLVISTEELVCKGKECCKEYIKSFLAAIPISELEADIKKGLVPSIPLHLLQIEFHYIEASKDLTNFAVFPPPPFLME